MYIIRWKWFRVFVGGNYSWVEIDFGELGYWELVIHFINKDNGLNRLVEWHINEFPRTYLCH